MKVAKNLFNRLRRDETGASLVEYGLLVGLIAVACIIAVTAMGTSISNLLDRTGDELDSVNPAS